MPRHVASRGRYSRPALDRQSSQVASARNNVVSQEGSQSNNPEQSSPTPNGRDDQTKDANNQTELSSMSNQHPSHVHPSPNSGTPSRPSTPIVSQINEESVPLPNSEPDTREIIEVIGAKKLDAIGKAVLSHTIHFHFDGPYINWGEVEDGTRKQWWKMFKKQCRWDKGRFSEEHVFKAFNHEGSRHLSRILSPAHNENCSLVWIKEKIWDEMMDKWGSKEFKHKSEVNKRNRAIATEKGIPPYRGGSITTTAHVKKMKDKNGYEPDPKEIYEMCHKKKDGTLSEEGQKNVANYVTLLEHATQEAQDSEVPQVIDKNKIWINATGGVRKGRIVGMGYEAEAMLKKTRYLRVANRLGPSEASEYVGEDLMVQLSTMTRAMTSLGEKITVVQQNQEDIRKDLASLGDTVQQNHVQGREDITNMEDYVNKSIEACQTETRLNQEILEKGLQEIITSSIKSFFASKKSS